MAVKQAVKTQSKRLSDLIAPSFYAAHRDLIAGNHTYYDMYGGRGSTKSSWISLELVTGVMSDPNANAVVFRRYGNTIATSVFEQVLWAIHSLGAEELWRWTTSPHKCIYKPTGQVILFRGLDDPQKVKSIKVSKGYIKYLWMEELDEFAGEEQIRSVQQSVLRGGSKFVVFKSFNPPISKTNWANQYVAIPRPDAYRLKSTYLDVPREWLGGQFFNDAEILKQINLKAYEHEYLGEAVGAGGEVFENLEARELTDEEILTTFGQCYMGLDWGWVDPFQWVHVYYNPNRLTLYIFDEYRAHHKSNRDTWEDLQTLKHVRPGIDLITADAAEPKSIGDYRAWGAYVRPAEKGPNSVKTGIKWLQSLNKIVIDPIRCPNVWNEFSNYEYKRTKEGEVLEEYPDENNHSIDAVRYAMESVYKRRGR